MSNRQEKVEQITKESIDQELMEKAMVDQKILYILDHIQLYLIIVLVGVMIYLTYIKLRDYLRKKKKEQEDLIEEQRRDLERSFYERQKDNK